MESKVHPVSVVARRANVSEKTLYDWRKQAASNPEFQALLDQKRQALALKLHQAADLYVDKITDLVDTADLNNKASTAMGILLDKALAYSGQPSTITEHRHLHLDLTSEAISALQAYLDAGFSEQEARADLAAADPDLFRALPPGPIIDLEAEDAGEDEDEATSEAPLEDASPDAL